ncbi:hypothetical protein BAE44_0010276 [Dichanthelium oligosanthes]|uniref:RING-type domain-containing protein n=1 Tax=Dichanthelium oligosanthes TaxID=888268 RepID=A0A1E5VUA2_9POAL|nr:hypothetical protein BAE44_0010276 [Dichanthelium oligosanthes]
MDPPHHVPAGSYWRDLSHVDDTLGPLTSDPTYQGRSPELARASSVKPRCVQAPAQSPPRGPTLGILFLVVALREWQQKGGREWDTPGASEFLRDYDGSVIQMRMAYSAVAHFLVQWTDCKLAGALGLLKIMLYKVYVDGSSALPDSEREASIREFYGVIFPSLLQLPSGITELDERKQRRLCLKKFRSRDEELSEVDTERELECGICLEVSRKIVLPDCAHTLCMRCFEDWNAKSKSCPFCRACLEEVKPGSLWMYTDDSDVVDMDTLTRENIRRLFMYINKLPLVVLHVVDLDIYEYRIK